MKFILVYATHGNEDYVSRFIDVIDPTVYSIQCGDSR